MRVCRPSRPFAFSPHFWWVCFPYLSIQMVRIQFTPMDFILSKSNCYIYINFIDLTMHEMPAEIWLCNTPDAIGDRSPPTPQCCGLDRGCRRGAAMIWKKKSDAPLGQNNSKKNPSPHCEILFLFFITKCTSSQLGSCTHYVICLRCLP
jgi:hypothetical protein